MSRRYFFGKNFVIASLPLLLVFLLGLSGLSYAEMDVRNILKEGASSMLTIDLPNRKGIKLGDLIVDSALKVTNQFDSNIYLAHTGEHADVLQIINPSIGFKLPVQDNVFTLSYDAAFNYFDNFPVNNHIDHRVNASAEINWTDYKLTFVDTYRRFRDRTGTEDVNRTKRQTNGFAAGIETREWNRLFFAFNYSNFLQNYLSTDLVLPNLTYKDKSYMVNAFGLDANYRIFSKTYLLWENNYGFIRYTKSDLPPGSYFVESLLGVKGELTDKIAANIKGGFKLQNYETSTVLSSKDYCNFVAKGGLDYFATKKDTWSLSLERGIYESTYSIVNYYELNSVGLNYAHQFNHKVTGNLFASVQSNLYPTATTEGGLTAKRKDGIYYGGCSLTYGIKDWLAVEAKYQFERRDSKFSAFTYVDNLVTLTGTIGF
jgi:hypothetical protein